MRWLSIIGRCGLLLMAGCAGYQVGTRSLYQPDIQTVYVPVFDSKSFRPGLGERLTEAVVKEIELKTPYKVVGSPGADSVLSGRILDDTKRVLITRSTDEPRQLAAGIRAEVRWVNRRGDLIREPQFLPLPPEIVIRQTAPLVPEGGQSIASAQQRAIQRLAEQIVSTMEIPW